MIAQEGRPIPWPHNWTEAPTVTDVLGACPGRQSTDALVLRHDWEAVYRNHGLTLCLCRHCGGKP